MVFLTVCVVSGQPTEDEVLNTNIKPIYKYILENTRDNNYKNTILPNTNTNFGFDGKNIDNFLEKFPPSRIVKKDSAIYEEDGNKEKAVKSIFEQKVLKNISKYICYFLMIFFSNIIYY